MARARWTRTAPSSRSIGTSETAPDSCRTRVPNPTHVYAAKGGYTVTLTVTDDDGATDTCATAADVNAPPMCDAGPSQSGDVGDSLSFDGSASSDMDGSIVQFDWDFGDGGGFMNGLGAMPSHVYGGKGLFTVTLRVTDDDGAVVTCSTAADVNLQPMCDAGQGQFGDVNEALSFDGSGSSDMDGSVDQFDWDFGDGAGFIDDLGPTPSHAYATAGSFNVTLRITDDDGATSTCPTTANVNALRCATRALRRLGTRARR